MCLDADHFDQQQVMDYAARLDAEETTRSYINSRKYESSYYRDHTNAIKLFAHDMELASFWYNGIRNDIGT